MLLLLTLYVCSILCVDILGRKNGGFDGYDDEAEFARFGLPCGGRLSRSSDPRLTSNGRPTDARWTSDGRPSDVRRTSAGRPTNVRRTSNGQMSARRTSDGRQTSIRRLIISDKHVRAV